MSQSWYENAERMNHCWDDILSSTGYKTKDPKDGGYLFQGIDYVLYDKNIQRINNQY